MYLTNLLPVKAFKVVLRFFPRVLANIILIGSLRGFYNSPLFLFLSLQQFSCFYVFISYFPYLSGGEQL